MVFSKKWLKFLLSILKNCVNRSFLKFLQYKYLQKFPDFESHFEYVAINEYLASKEHENKNTHHQEKYKFISIILLIYLILIQKPEESVFSTGCRSVF